MDDAAVIGVGRRHRGAHESLGNVMLLGKFIFVAQLILIHGGAFPVEIRAHAAAIGISV